MTLTGIRALRAEERAKREPLLPLLSFDLCALIADVKGETFPQITIHVPYWFVKTSHLAFVTIENPSIFIHPLLNRSDVPHQIFRHIIVHELLHLVVPSRKVGAKRTDHPPEFWTLEQQLSIDRTVVWDWLYQNFWEVLTADDEEEATKVKRLRKHNWRPELLTWEHVLNNPLFRSI
jgi:hypothetical protein